MSKRKVVYSLVLFLFALTGCSEGGKGKICQTRDACVNDANCRCWCSHKCDYRKKNATDDPIYIENDPNGKFCYCKQWDLDNYEKCADQK